MIGPRWEELVSLASQRRSSSIHDMPRVVVFSGPQDEKPDFRHFHSFGGKPTLGLRSLQSNMLHSSLGLEPRTLFILQGPAVDVARHMEPQGMTSNLATTAMGSVNSARSRLFRRGAARAGRERHGRIGRRHGACYTTFSSAGIFSADSGRKKSTKPKL